MGNSYNSCNLGSINLYNFVLNPFTPSAKFDFDRFKVIVERSISALDEVLDYGYEMQPLEQNKKCVEDWRAIGLGIMGMADMFVALGMRYGDEKSIELMDSIMNTMQVESVRTSANRAKKFGTFLKYNYDYIKKSTLFNSLPTEIKTLVKENGLRNCSLISVAPAGTLSSMTGVSGGCEPFFRISYERTTHAQEDGNKETFTVFARAVEHLLNENNIDPKEVSVEDIQKMFPFVVASQEIPWRDRVKMQSTMQKYIDNAISSTINLPEETSVEDIFNIYMEAWKSGCKGITIFRDNCLRPSILGVSKDDIESKYGIEFDSIAPLKRKNLPDDTDFKSNNGIAHTACVKNMHGFVTELDNNLFEVFTFPSGGCTSNIATITRLCSLAFRSGIKVEEVLDELRATNCPACMKMREQGNDKISKSCGNAIADIIVKAYKKEIKKDESYLLPCPKCGEHTMIPEGKCATCSNCGYSHCS